MCVSMSVGGLVLVGESESVNVLNFNNNFLASVESAKFLVNYTGN